LPKWYHNIEPISGTILSEACNGLMPNPYSLPGSPATGLRRWGGYSLPYPTHRHIEQLSAFDDAYSPSGWFAMIR